MLPTTGILLYLLLSPLSLSHLKAESLNLLTLRFHLLLFVAQLSSEALLCRPVKIKVTNVPSNVKKQKGWMGGKWKRLYRRSVSVELSSENSCMATFLWL